MTKKASKGFKKGDVRIIPIDEAREYGDKVVLVDMKASKYRVLVDIPDADIKKAQKSAVTYRKDGAKIAKEAKAKKDKAADAARKKADQGQG